MFNLICSHLLDLHMFFTLIPSDGSNYFIGSLPVSSDLGNECLRYNLFRDYFWFFKVVVDSTMVVLFMSFHMFLKCFRIIETCRMTYRTSSMFINFNFLKLDLFSFDQSFNFNGPSCFSIFQLRLLFNFIMVFYHI